ncbi:MAG: peptidoglycan-binding domain-containing protein [Eubacteriales bacterium]|nr:peptidoglycan-binding domain-containing protein [Eubacteriales bacterium]
MRHTGISLGDGRVADARGHKSGVLLTASLDYPWTHYAVPYSMEAGSLPPFPDPSELRQGSRGQAVRKLQERLMALGYHLKRYGADGVFGRETAGALRAFQHVAGLPPTGIGDAGTLALLQISKEENT